MWASLFFKNGPIPASFVYFRPFLITISILPIEKNIDGVLGIRTSDHRMEGADNTTELWWPLKWASLLPIAIIYIISNFILGGRLSGKEHFPTHSAEHYDRHRRHLDLHLHDLRTRLLLVRHEGHRREPHHLHLRQGELR